MQKAGRRFLILLGCTVLALSVVAIQPAAAQASVRAYIVVDGKSGHILLKDEEDDRLPIASLTKVATAMVVLDWADVTNTDLAARVVLPSSIQTVGGANPVGLQPGDQVSLRDLLYCALMQSDNRAAYALGLYVGSQLGRTSKAADAEIAFVKQMNALANKLGMKRTGFINAHGLEQGDKSGLSTAEDLARLTRYALGHRGFLFYVSQPQRQISFERNGQPYVYEIKNTNTMLGLRTVDGVETKIDGIKTGMTRRAGGCLILSSERPPATRNLGDGQVEVTPRRLIIVVLGSNDRFGVAGNLLSRGWRAYSQWAREGRPTSKRESL